MLHTNELPLLHALNDRGDDGGDVLNEATIKWCKTMEAPDIVNAWQFFGGSNLFIDLDAIFEYNISPKDQFGPSTNTS